MGNTRYDRLPIRTFRLAVAMLFAVGLFMAVPAYAPAAVADYSSEVKAAKAARDIANLFGDEMRQAAAKLKWRGEHLTDDTLYAAALTGLSWEPAWNNKDRLFTLAWGDIRRTAGRGKQDRGREETAIGEIRRQYERRDYGMVVTLATGNFSIDEIGCDPNLKEPVGFSLLAQGQPERAFPILSAPFDPTRAGAEAEQADARFREGAWKAAQHAGLTREAIVFALSVLLDPGTNLSGVNTDALNYLETEGVDIDRVLLGVLQAPEHLPGLPAYYYAAADLLAYRASPPLLPFFLHLVNSDDDHLRSRALLGLGILAYHPRPNDPPGWSERIVGVPLRYVGLSASERKMIEDEIHQGINSDKYRVRQAAALALALVDAEQAVPLLRKLAADRAYILSAPEAESRARRILFPVRQAAAVGLARFGIRVETGSGEFAGKALDTARRGGQDVTNDRRNLHREVAGTIAVSPLDVAESQPQTSRR